MLCADRREQDGLRLGRQEARTSASVDRSQSAGIQSTSMHAPDIYGLWMQAGQQGGRRVGRSSMRDQQQDVRSSADSRQSNASLRQGSEQDPFTDRSRQQRCSPFTVSMPLRLLAQGSMTAMTMSVEGEGTLLSSLLVSCFVASLCRMSSRIWVHQLCREGSDLSQANARRA